MHHLCFLFPNFGIVVQFLELLDNISLSLTTMTATKFTAHYTTNYSTLQITMSSLQNKHVALLWVLQLYELHSTFKTSKSTITTLQCSFHMHQPRLLLYPVSPPTHTHMHTHRNQSQRKSFMHFNLFGFWHFYQLNKLSVIKTQFQE